MATLATLTIDLVGKSAKLTAELNKASGKTKSWAASTRSMVNTSAKAFSAMGVTAVAGLAIIYKKQAELIDQTAKLADSIGISTEALTELRYASELTGVGADKFDSAITKMTRNIAEAATGSGTASDALEQLGVSASELNQLTPDEQLNVLADALSGVELQSDKVAIAIDLFGKSGAGMVNMLATGSDGLMSMREEAESLGISLSRIDAAKVELANDAMTRVEATSTAIAQGLTTSMAPIVAGLAEEFSNYAKEHGGWNEVITNGMGYAVKGVGILADGFRGIEIIIAGVDVAWQGLKLGFIAGTQLMVNAVYSVGEAIIQGIVYPLQQTLEGLAPYSDKAAEMAASLKDMTTFKPPQLFDVSTANQAQLDLDQSIYDMQILALQPLPSKGIDDWFTNTTQKFDDLATKQAEFAAGNRNPGVRSEPVTEDGETPKKNNDVATFNTATAEITQAWEERRAILADQQNQERIEEQFSYDAKLLALNTQFEAAKLAVANDQEAKRTLQNQYNTAEQELYDDHQATLTNIKKEQDAERVKSTQASADKEKAAQKKQMQFYNGMSSAVGEFYGDMGGSHSEYVDSAINLGGVLLDEEKQNAITSIWTNTYDTAMKAYNSLASIPFVGPALGAAAAGVVMVAGGAYSAKVAGMAHSGISEVPNEGTWLLDKGERVYTNDSANKLDQMHNSIMGGTSSGNASVVVNLIEDASRAGSVDQSSDGDITTLDIRVAKLLQSSNTQTSAVMKTRYRSPQYGR